MRCITSCIRHEHSDPNSPQFGNRVDMECREWVHEKLEYADTHGDGPMVNALCWWGRRVFGPCMHW